MLGGRLVVLDRQGRDVKYYPLKEGLATLGSDPICDIRFMLPTVSAHHATVSVHTNQCVVHAVGTDPTLVNGTVVSVAALRHGDEISVGGRRLRWEYNDPSQKRVTQMNTMPALARRSTGKRNARRRVTTGSGKPALVPPLRASMPARDWRSGETSSSSSGKQVAIVQPWGKDTNNQIDSINKSATKGKRTRSLRLDDAIDIEEQPKRRWASLGGGDSATKASLWCESRRAPRRTPLKIHDPPGVDHTKQAALMLMTGHTPKPKETPPRPTPTRRKRVSGTKRRTRPSQPTPRPHRATEGPHSISLLEIGPVSRRSEGSARTERSNFLTSPILGSPKKSALKDPSARKSTRKTESIKFDLSNLDGHERSSDVIIFDESEKDVSGSQDDLTLHYSESSSTMSPSPKKNSRSSRILEKSLRSSNTFTTLSPRQMSSERSTLEATALEKTSSTVGRSPKKSLRGSIILKKALENSRAAYKASRSRISDQSYATAGSPRASIRQTETYSVVDLVSLDSDSSKSVYGSTASFESPQSVTSQSVRRTRSGKLSLLASSTPYHGKAKVSPKDEESDRETSRNKSRGRSSVSDASSTGKKPSMSIVSVRSEPNQTNISDKSKKSTRRSASLTTPENSYWSLSLNTTKATRASKSRSRLNDSDLLLLDDDDDASPRSSRRRSGPTPRKNISILAESPSSDIAEDGCVTPENEHSPQDAGTPVLNIQNLLDQSLDRNIRVRNSRKRKTIGHIRSVKRPNVSRAKSFTQTRRSKKADISNEKDGIITPTSDVKLVPEGVKNKHSTAKKPQSKRSLIDTLDESDVVKQLFSSPVKRNLSQSMSDFNWRDDDKPVTRHTIALTGRSLNTSSLSVLNDSAQIAPEVFVSPLGTPNISPNLSGMKRLFARGTTNDLSDVRGVKALLKTPRARRSIGNDLTRVSGVKKTFARSPKNRLSDVRVKELFVPSPKNDLRRVSGVKALFQSVETKQMSSPNVQNIRGLFKRTPRNELVNVSGVRALKRRSPRNDLEDVEGIDQLFEEPAAGDVSGVELLQEQEDADSTFDRLLGKPKLKSYGKSKSMTIFGSPKQKRAAKSLHDSINAINTNVEEWLQGQLQRSANKINSENSSRELQKLSTATVEGAAPVLASRSRSSTLAKDQSTLPIKKRSIASLNQSSKAELTRSRVSLGRSKAELSLSRKSSEPSTRKSKGDTSKRTSKGETSLSRSKVEKSRNSRAEASLGKSKGESAEISQSKVVAPASLRLPIKKRVVVHSTPVKGVNATLNTTALARMSPIAVIDPPTKTALSTLNESRKYAGKSKRSLQKQLPEIIVSATNSPKKVEAKNKTQTPIQPRTTRRKAAETKLPTVIKRRKSITITKKPPVLSPKPVKQVPEKPVSPKRGRSTRNKVEEKTKTPVKSRAKARRTSVVVSKPSPKLKPKSATPTKGTNRTRKTKVVEEPPKVTQARQTRKTKATENLSNASKKSKLEAEKSVEKQTVRARTRKTQSEEIPQETELKTARRGRKTQEIKNIEEPPKRSRKTANSKVENKSTSKQESPKKSPEKSAPKRSRRGQTNVTIVEVNKTVIDEPKPRRGRKAETVTEVIEVKKGRKTRANQSVVQATETAPKRARTAKAEMVTEAKPARGRKTVANQSKEEPKGRRSKKVTIVEEVSEIQQKGRRTKTQSTSEDKNTSKKSGKQIVESPAPKGRRTTRNTTVKDEPSTGRGKKASVNANTNKTAAANKTSRKRKSVEPVAKVAEAAKRRKLPVKEAEEQRSTRSRRR